MKLRYLVLVLTIANVLSATPTTADIAFDFDTDDEGFTVRSDGGVQDPWIYDSQMGAWSVGGSTNVGSPTSSGLRTRTFEVETAGSLGLTFDHRYSIEWDGTTRWDGAALRYRVNDGGFQHIEGRQFSDEGYVDVIAGNNVLNGLEGFSDVSTGYFEEEYITSVVDLGSFEVGDLVQVEFLGAWDEFARGSPDGTVPNWEINSVAVSGSVAIVPDLPEPPLFVGGEGVIGEDVFMGSRSNEVFGPPEPGVPGFTGRIVTFDEHGLTLNNHTIAEDVLDDFDGETAIGTYDVVDFAGGNGTYSVNNAYPNDINDASQDDFVVQVTADVVIPAGDWAIAFGSDDGGQVTLAGIELIEFTHDNFEDDQIRFEGNRGHGWTVGTFELSEPLTTTLVGSFHERGGGDSFEIAVLDDSILETPNPGNSWELLGDGVFDWSVTTASEPLLSADLLAAVPTEESYRFDVNGDTGEADQFVLPNSDPAVFTTILGVDGATFQIKSVGTVTSGESFQIIDADVIVGTPTIVSSDPTQTWVFDGTTGLICLDSCAGGLLGDFNGDGAVTVADLDVMTLGDPAFDVTGDGVADNADLDEMLVNLIGTWRGDSDGDGLFGTADFVAVFTVGKFETGEAAVWSEGDWNLDGSFDTTDFVAAFTEGGFEQGPRPSAVVAVPEPSGFVMLLAGLFGFLRDHRKRKTDEQGFRRCCLRRG